ncbi:MAG: small conductance mechanosensitive channel [Gammaproteobacteria bacterium]|jgi:small conductance mechanosensitive channel
MGEVLAEYSLPLGLALCLGLTLFIAHRVLMSGPKAKGAEARLPRQLTMFGITLVGLLIVLLSMPLPGDVRSDVLGLVGIAFTAVIALSSTTFVSNAMAGLMIRIINCFRPGDFVRVKSEFGRISERGLFHTELQNEDGDLTTLPNLYLMTNPVSVVRKSGTIISATVSLGYDEPWEKIETLLKQAARKTELLDSFVQVLELGDFTIVYKIAGFTDNVSSLLTLRSNLRKEMLDVLHGANVEIMSPTFMTQRQITPDDAMIPTRTHRSAQSKRVEPAPEEKIFDKANRAASIEDLKAKYSKLTDELEELAGTKPGAAEKEAYAEQKKLLQNKADELLEQIENGSKQISEGDNVGIDDKP